MFLLIRILKLRAFAKLMNLKNALLLSTFPFFYNVYLKVLQD